MDLLLQLWAGGCYLSNKVLFAFSEGRKPDTKRTLKLWGWSLYILGVPAWVVILIGKHDWIAASIEAGGLPAMLLGLWHTWRNPLTLDRQLNRLVQAFTYGALVFGLLVSLRHHGGLASVTQLLEIAVMVGFLLGSYLMARNNPAGWLFFMLMNVSMATLMGLQDKHILMLQQLLSLGFVVYGFSRSRKRAHENG